MPLPLHIFEERYKEMIRRCLDKRSEFGIVYYAGENFYQIGCGAVINKILKEYEDGRMDLLVIGSRRFRILRMLEEKPYLVAEVEHFDDSTTSGEMTEIRKKTVDLFQQALEMSGRHMDRAGINELTPLELSFLISAGAGFTLPEKQAFLEMTSTEQRLEKAGTALQKLLQRLQMTKDIESIISGNGRLHHRIKTDD